MYCATSRDTASSRDAPSCVESVSAEVAAATRLAITDFAVSPESSNRLAVSQTSGGSSSAIWSATSWWPKMMKALSGEPSSRCGNSVTVRCLTRWRRFSSSSASSAVRHFSKDECDLLSVHRLQTISWLPESSRRILAQVKRTRIGTDAMDPGGSPKDLSSS